MSKRAIRMTRNFIVAICANMAGLHMFTNWWLAGGFCMIVTLGVAILSELGEEGRQS